MQSRSLSISLGALAVLTTCLGSLAFAADPTDNPFPDAPPAPAPGGPAPGPMGPGLTDPNGTPPAPGDETHDYKLRELEEKVIDLKEKVFRSKTRLLLLKERLLNDVIAEAKVVIFHENDMGSSFKPVQVLYHLDGEKIYFQDDSSKVLDDKQTLEIFNQNMTPGNHVLAVEMVYRGDSTVFNYLKDYNFKLRASYTFYATKGKITTVRAIGYQKGDITYDLRDRPSITFDVKQISYTADQTKIEDQKPPAPGTPTNGPEIPTNAPMKGPANTPSPSPEPAPAPAPSPEMGPAPAPAPTPNKDD